MTVSPQNNEIRFAALSAALRPEVETGPTEPPVFYRKLCWPQPFVAGARGGECAA